MKRVELKIGDQFYDFAKGRAERYGYAGVAEYLSDLLGTALVVLRDEASGEDERLMFLPDRPSSDERKFQFELVEPALDCFAEIEEDEGGGLRLKTDPGGSEDLDDGIPF